MSDFIIIQEGGERKKNREYNGGGKNCFKKDRKAQISPLCLLILFIIRQTALWERTKRSWEKLERSKIPGLSKIEEWRPRIRRGDVNRQPSKQQVSLKGELR